MKYLSILLFAFSINIFSQTKKEILINEDNTVISLKEFKNKIAPPDYKYTYITFDTDTAVIAKLVLRNEYGELEKDPIKIIRQELAKLTGKLIDSTQTILINYFFEEHTTNKNLAINHYPYNKKYKRFFKRKDEFYQVFMTEKGFMHKENYVYEDKNEIIRKLLFKYPFASNYVIIRPNDHFYRRVGEHRQDEIPDIIKADW